MSICGRCNETFSWGIVSIDLELGGSKCAQHAVPGSEDLAVFDFEKRTNLAER
jgi:hypothetical protein